MPIDPPLEPGDGFESLASDQADRQRHQIQMTGQFLVDRDGVIRWSRTETTGTYARFPATEELLSLAERFRAEALRAGAKRRRHGG